MSVHQTSNRRFQRGRELRRQFDRQQLARSLRRHIRAQVTAPLPYQTCISEAFLLDAARYVRTEGGPGPGPDGISLQQLSNAELSSAIRELSQLLDNGEFLSSLPRRAEIPRPGRSPRMLTLRSAVTRIVGTAVKFALEGFWESRFHPVNFGFRRRRSVAHLLLSLETSIYERQAWILAQDDLQAAFDHVPIQQVTDLHRAEGVTEDYVSLIEKLLRGHPSEQREIGIDQGGPYSPTAMNVLLTFHLDRPLHMTDGQSPVFRYADNLAVAAASFEEATERLDQTRQQLLPLGMRLKGESEPVDLRRLPVELLGFQLRAHEGHIAYDLHEEAWAQLTSDFMECHESPMPHVGAQAILEGWLRAFVPALAAMPVDQLRETAAPLAARYGFRELNWRKAELARAAAVHQWCLLRRQFGLT
jgi:hypothetical protein